MKKVTSLVTCIAMLFSLFSTSTFATDTSTYTNIGNNDAEILELINALAAHRAEKINSGDASTTLDTVELQIEEELINNGAEPLTPDEVNSQFGESLQGVSPYVTVPSTTSNVRWYTWTSSYTTGGTTYSVQHVSATALTNNTNLAIQAVGKAIFTGKQYALYSAYNALAFYANAAVSGYTKVLGYLPVELFGSADVAKFTDAAVTYSGVASVVFSYVKISGQTDYYQTLSLVSNSLNYSGSVAVTGIKSGQPVTKSKDTSFSTQSYYFGSTSRAVQNYLNNSTGQSLLGTINVNFAEIASGTGATSYSITVPGPTAPSQVTG